MAITADRVIVELQAKVDTYNANVLRAENNFTRSMASMQRGASQMAIAVAKGFVAFQAANLAVDAARALVDYAQAAVRVSNALRIAGLSGAELTDVYNKLLDSAQKNAVPIEALTQLYGRLSLVQGELNITSEELIRFTDNVGLALRVSGKSAQEAQGALLQLSQALGSGVVRAEEFNSILEGALPVAQAAAAGLEEAGGSVAKLRSLVIDGKVSSEAFFRAFEAGSVILEDKVAGAALTVDQAIVRLNNALTDAAGKFDESVGLTRSLTAGLQTVTQWVENLGNAFATNAEPIRVFNGILQNTLAYLDAISRAGTATPIGRSSELDISKNVGRTNFGLLPESDPALQKALDEYARRQASGGSVKTVSLNDFDPPDSGGGSGSKKSPGQKFSDALQRVSDMTAEIDLETASIGRGTEVKERALMVERLLNDARDAGLKVTPEVRAAIDETAAAYAQAAAEMERVQAEQDRINSGLEEFKSFASDAMRGFIDDIQEGKTAAEALGGVFDKLADKLIDIAIQNLFASAFGGGGGTSPNALGTIIGSFFGGPKGFASGTSNTGGARGQVRGFVHGQEAVIPLPSGGKVPVDIGGGARGDIVFSPTLNMPGADSAAVARAMAELRTMQAEFVPRVRQEIVTRGRKW